MTATPAQALARAHNQSVNGPRYDTGMCLRATRRLYDVPALYGDAAAAAAQVEHRLRLLDAPAGALLWWTGGSHGHGHVALYAGDGYCWSVDIRRPGYFDKVPVVSITREWGLTFIGASLDVNGVKVVPEPPRPSPNLDHAIGDLVKARDARKPGPVRRSIREAIAIVRGVKAGRR